MSTRSEKNLLRCGPKYIGKGVPREVGLKVIAEAIVANCQLQELSGCLRWQGGKFVNGYGQKQFQGKRCRVHRLVYEAAHGPIPEKMAVCHTCDVRDCCNIDHLWLGTWQDNAIDMAAKGRHVRSPERLTHCPIGHAYADNARYTKDGARACRVCQRAAQRKRAGWPEELWWIPPQPIGHRPPQLSIKHGWSPPKSTSTSEDRKP